jgi:hypothetical protein
MRHEQIDVSSSLDEASLAAVWPSGPDFTPAGVEAAAIHSRATPAAPDVPPAVGKLLVGVYAAMIGIFMATLGGSREAAFMITISAAYVAIYCAVPWIFFRVEKDPSRRPSMSKFMARGLDTWTGHASGRDALVQMLIVPVMLTFCILCIGLTAAAII